MTPRLWHCSIPDEDGAVCVLATSRSRARFKAAGMLEGDGYLTIRAVRLRDAAGALVAAPDDEAGIPAILRDLGWREDDADEQCEACGLFEWWGIDDSTVDPDTLTCGTCTPLEPL